MVCLLLISSPARAFYFPPVLWNLQKDPVAAGTCPSYTHLTYLLRNLQEDTLAAGTWPSYTHLGNNPMEILFGEHGIHKQVPLS